MQARRIAIQSIYNAPMAIGALDSTLHSPAQCLAAAEDCEPRHAKDARRHTVESRFQRWLGRPTRQVSRADQGRSGHTYCAGWGSIV
jgi:hypothetical protein